jgi:homoserine O-acetyltransferase
VTSPATTSYGRVGGVGPTRTRYATIATAEDPMALTGGQSLGPITLAYEMYGELNGPKDNAILVFHALTGSQHAAGFNPSVPEAGDRWTDEVHTGWWDAFIGPGRALDTNRFAVICINYLGGCYGSTGPSTVDPRTGVPYGSRFPRVSLVDIVESQIRVLDHLGIERLHGVIGASVGGLMCLALATRNPDRVRNVIAIASGLRVTALQRIHIFEQCLAIENDPDFRGGDYYDGPAPDRGLALARMVGHKSFVSLRTMEERARWEVIDRDAPGGHVRIVHPLESYMWHQGTKFVERFDANSYLRIMEMWQTFELSADGSVGRSLERCRDQSFMVFTIDTDVCYYPEEQEELVAELKRAGVPVRRVTVHSENGHDAFLLEPELFAPHLAHTLEGNGGHAE